MSRRSAVRRRPLPKPSIDRRRSVHGPSPPTRSRRSRRQGRKAPRRPPHGRKWETWSRPLRRFLTKHQTTDFLDARLAAQQLAGDPTAIEADDAIGQFKDFVELFGDEQ